MHISEILNDAQVDSIVTVRGWVYRSRESGRLVFLVVRDSTGIVQVVVEKGVVTPEEFEAAKKCTIETSIEVEGKCTKEQKAVTGYELHATKIKVYQFAENFPITKDKSDEFLLDIRHLWLRSREMTAIMKMRESILYSIRNYMREKGYHEVQPPMFVGGMVEGGSTLFEVPYFGEKAYLTQSSQFYLEAFMFSLENVYTISPSFRAEKSRTRRHLTEYSHYEAEAAWVGNQGMMDLEEDMIVYIAQHLLESNREELEIVKRDPEKIRGIEKPFYRYRYEKVIEIGREKGLQLDDAADLGESEERTITEDFDRPIFVYNFPTQLKPFYHRPDPDDPSHVLNHDVLAPEGYGEVIGGGERIWKKEELIARMKSENLNPDDYKWYVDLRSYGSVPHSGFGLGVDRVLTWLAGLDHINKAVPFPRTMRRLKP
ncbi:MAG: asparagine--tRNA ligase [Candidatus Thermoplasmatota archaeon]|jgi:asparaginyl-tRNA synthetase|nr:asparagine--tRNA ligase [Candidatus Thermoplasmatota archaeon]MCL5790206.1 asparagine--tRNA ligase [Candidatus Thermoplasmatota archaeon]